MTEYQARITQDDDGRWSAWVEGLSGCAVWGYSQAEARNALDDAVAAWIEDMVDAGEAVPPALAQLDNNRRPA